jgi:negative regulator of sigma F NrsF-like protein
MSSNHEEDTMAEIPWPQPVEPPPELTEAIRRTCTQGLGKKRGWSSAQRLGLSLLISGGLILLLHYAGIVRGRPETALRAALYGALGWIVVTAVVLFLGLARPPCRRGSRALRIGIVTVVPVLFFTYLGFAGTGRVPLNEFLFSGHHAGWAIGCGAIAAFFGAIAAGSLWFVWRGTDPLTPGLSGALAGMTGGMVGASAMGCACAATETWHLWASHGLMLVGLSLVGWLVGRRWLAP